MAHTPHSPHGPAPGGPGDQIVALRAQVEEESANGRALVADISDNPVGTVAVDPEVPCVHLVWRGYATDLQIRYVHEMMLLSIRGEGIAKLLGDNTGLPALGEDVRRWIATDWLPRAVEAGLRVCAATEPRSIFAERPLKELIAQLAAPLVTRFFDDIGEARAWLKAYAL